MDQERDGSVAEPDQDKDRRLLSRIMDVVLPASDKIVGAPGQMLKTGRRLMTTFTRWSKKALSPYGRSC